MNSAEPTAKAISSAHRILRALCPDWSGGRSEMGADVLEKFRLGVQAHCVWFTRTCSMERTQYFSSCRLRNYHLQRAKCLCLKCHALLLAFTQVAMEVGNGKLLIFLFSHWNCQSCCFPVRHASKLWTSPENQMLDICRLLDITFYFLNSWTFLNLKWILKIKIKYTSNSQSHKLVHFFCQRYLSIRFNIDLLMHI